MSRKKMDEEPYTFALKKEDLAYDSTADGSFTVTDRLKKEKSPMKDKPEPKMSGMFQESKVPALPVGVLGACPAGRDVEGQGCSLNMNHAGDHAIVRVK